MTGKNVTKSGEHRSQRYSGGDKSHTPGSRLRTARSGLPSARYYEAPERLPGACFYHAPRSIFSFLKQNGGLGVLDNKQKERFQRTQEHAAMPCKAGKKCRKRRWVLPLVMVLVAGAIGGVLFLLGNGASLQWKALLSPNHTAIPTITSTPSAAQATQASVMFSASPEAKATPTSSSEPTKSPQPTMRPSATPQATAVVTPAVYETLRTGDTGEAVTQLQKTLIELGYLREDQLDGSYGGITRRAVGTFQRVNQLKVDGVAGSQTQQLLYSGDALPNIEE